MDGKTVEKIRNHLREIEACLDSYSADEQGDKSPSVKVADDDDMPMKRMEMKLSKYKAG